jgi:hypothetical protein
LLDQFE